MDCKHCFHVVGTHREPGIHKEIKRCCHCNERREENSLEREKLLRELRGDDSLQGWSQKQNAHGPHAPPPPTPQLSDLSKERG